MTDATAGFGTLFQRETATAAYLETGSGGSDNAITWTAVTEGTGGNSITITIANQGGTAAMSVAVAGNDITVNPETSAGAIVGTAEEVILGVLDDADASALVIPWSSSSSDGSGVVGAVSETNLANGAAGLTYATVGEVTNIGLGASRDSHDVTHHASTGGWREFIVGLMTMGQITIDCNYLPMNVTHNHVTGLARDLIHGTQRNFKVIFTDSGTTTWIIPGLVMSTTAMAPADGKLALSVTIQATGEPTLA